MKTKNEWKQAINRCLCVALGCVLLLSGCGTGKTGDKSGKKQVVQEKTVTAEPDATAEPTINPDDITQQPFYALMQEHKELLSTADDWKKVDGKYQYPIKITDDKWYNLDKAELRYAACAIPDEIMDKLNTKELLELVLGCPMFGVYEYYNSYYDGIVEYGQYFNGMYELMHRSDFYETIVNYYANMDIPKKLYYNPKMPKKPKPEDYDRVVEEAPPGAIEKDGKVYRTANFLSTIIINMAEKANGDDDVLAKAEKILLKKDAYIRTTEYADSIQTVEELLDMIGLDADRLSPETMEFAERLRDRLDFN